jgi:hypothetical protein
VVHGVSTLVMAEALLVERTLVSEQINITIAAELGDRDASGDRRRRRRLDWPSPGPTPYEVRARQTSAQHAAILALGLPTRGAS